MIIVDAQDIVAGRLASYVAREALKGKEVRIVNSEKAIIAGKKKIIFDDFLHRVGMGTPKKGPFIHRSPDRLLRRIVRGMLPYDKARGRDAHKRVLCYIGVPEEFNGKEIVHPTDGHKSKLPNYQYVTIGELSKRLGAKFE
ncbi:MAG: 50S ribosomal protein L13 [Candidatus Woesearchaeota archaeon]|nr:50S ribosomal protein L13 [Candidatus Woesearchaeota archaeon]